MRLAQAVSLSVPEVTLHRTQQQWLYLIRRYDRELGHDQKIKRLHQEDFCQALSILPEIKYEKEGGVSFSDCFKLGLCQIECKWYITILFFRLIIS